MVTIDDAGRLVFEMHATGAVRVEVVGAFEGWHEQALPMQELPGGRWSLAIDPGPGEYLFRYRIDGREWRLDDAAHGTVRTLDGVLKSRVCRPDASVFPGSQAA